MSINMSVLSLHEVKASPVTSSSHEAVEDEVPVDDVETSSE
jgi:hypothetical protein